MSSLPFLQVGSDFLLPPRIPFPPQVMNADFSVQPIILPLPILTVPTSLLLYRECHLMRLSERLYDAARLPVLPNNDTDFSDEIFDAVKANDKDRLLYFLKKRKAKPTPLSANNQKWTALHWAASRRTHKECLELLLRFDSCSIVVGKNDVTKTGETALHIACRFNCFENALLLLQKGWDVEKKTSNGDTALHIAVCNGFELIVRYLLSFGANIESKDSKGRTPLHLTAMCGRPNVLTLLLANGANIRSTDSEDNLPLHLACRKGNFEAARLLVKHDSASLNDKNCEGLTPFMLAVSIFDANRIRYLLEKGAKLGICDNQGRIAIDFAASSCDVPKFSLLVQSTSVDHLEQRWIHIWNRLTRKPVDSLFKFNSLTCLTIEKGLKHLNVLLESHLSTSILQMPSLRQDDANRCALVFSPLAYLFFRFAQRKNDAFGDCLASLLKHKVTAMDEFRRKFQPVWQIRGVQFINPLSILMCSTWPYADRKRHFDLLIENNVTTDYCLRCYHKNGDLFWTFDEYKRYYSLVIYAVEKFDVDVVKLLISNSVILEPDVLCNYLIMAYSKKHPAASEEETEKARDLYQYLIQLKPIYHKWYQPFDRYSLNHIPFMPAAEKISDEKLAKYCGTPYVFQKSPIFAASDEYPLPGLGPLSNDLRPFPYIPAAEEFAKVTLQQLCRTAIRHQLREPTLEDNVRNFRKKILALPLPNVLKEYLLFKD